MTAPTPAQLFAIEAQMRRRRARAIAGLLAALPRALARILPRRAAATPA